MRIGLVAPPWVPVPPAAYGGTERVVDRLARGLAARGHTVVLCASGDSTCPVTVRAPFEVARPDLICQTLPELYHDIVSFDLLGRVDVVHDHTLLGGFVRPPGGAPLVVTNHGPFDLMARRVYASLAQRATVVAISHSQARNASDGTVSTVIHHGLDAEEVPVGDGSGDHLAFLGRLCPDKGVVEAIEVAERAGVPLRIAAKCREPAEVAYFEAVVRPRLSATIEYVGELDGHEKYTLLGAARALLNPIQWEEPFGLVMIEALAAGTPVLATRRGSAPEIVDHGVTGYLADGLDDLVHAVGQVELIRRGRCREDVVERFSEVRMVEAHLSLYERVLRRSQIASGMPARVAG